MTPPRPLGGRGGRGVRDNEHLVRPDRMVAQNARVALHPDLCIKNTRQDIYLA